MRAIILAAGRGSRINEYSSKHPKCLIKIRNKTLLDWQIKALNDSGISKIAIVTGYKKEFFNNMELKRFENRDWDKTNMVQSLYCARDWLLKEKCIVSYSDIFYLSSAIKLLMNDISDLSITYDSNWLDLWSLRFKDPLSDAETFRLDKNNNLLEIGKRSKSVKDIEGQYMGLLSFTPYSWRLIEKMLFKMPKSIIDKIHMTDLLQHIIDKKILSIKALAYKDVWGEVDSINDLIASETNLKNRNWGS